MKKRRPLLTMKGKKCLFLAAAILSMGALAGCGNTNDSTTLNVVCFNGGFGREWIDDAVKIWEEQNPGYKIDLNATKDATSIISGNIAKKNNKDDVYIAVDTNWKRYAGQGKLLALDDLLEEEVENIEKPTKIL